MRNFAQAGGAGARHHEVRGGVCVLHAMVKCCDIIGDVFALVISGGQTIVSISGEMNNLQRVILQEGAHRKSI